MKQKRKPNSDNSSDLKLINFNHDLIEINDTVMHINQIHNIIGFLPTRSQFTYTIMEKIFDDCKKYKVDGFSYRSLGSNDTRQRNADIFMHKLIEMGVYKKHYPLYFVHFMGRTDTIVITSVEYEKLKKIINWPVI